MPRRSTSRVTGVGPDCASNTLGMEASFGYEAEHEMQTIGREFRQSCVADPRLPHDRLRASPGKDAAADAGSDAGLSNPVPGAAGTGLVAKAGRSGSGARAQER